MRNHIEVTESTPFGSIPWENINSDIPRCVNREKFISVNGRKYDILSFPISGTAFNGFSKVNSQNFPDAGAGLKSLTPPKGWMSDFHVERRKDAGGGFDKTIVHREYFFWTREEAERNMREFRTFLDGLTVGEVLALRGKENHVPKK